MNTDEILTATEAKLAAAHGATPIPWSQIIAIVMQIISGCATPTPKSVRDYVARPIGQLQLRRRFMASGMTWAQADTATKTATAHVSNATDDELTAFIAAELESR